MSVIPEYQPNFLDSLDQERIARPWRVMNGLAFALDWEQRAGNRLEYWTNTLGQPYTYGVGPGERTYLSRKTHSAIDLVRERLLARTGIFFHGCFINFYRDGRDSLGWHADDSESIDHTKPIAVVSFGGEREIQWREQGAKGMESIHSQLLEDGSLFLMPAGMQQTHFHRIPRADKTVEPRMSMTFRALTPW